MDNILHVLIKLIIAMIISEDCEFSAVSSNDKEDKDVRMQSKIS